MDSIVVRGCAIGRAAPQRHRYVEAGDFQRPQEVAGGDLGGNVAMDTSNRQHLGIR